VNTDVLFSSDSGEWATPQDLFDQVDSRFGLFLDVCAALENAKCPSFYGIRADGLKRPWDSPWWCNPPYGRGIGAWVEKAISAEAVHGVMLVPARTDTKWFRRAFDNAAELFLIEGRLKFGGATNSAPFPSCLFHFTRRYKGACRVSYWNSNEA
jgi:phage N-6-adenine-methyltransferase